jgi:hypothetical protein
MMIGRLEIICHDVWVPIGGLDGELIHLNPLDWIGGPIILLNPQWLEV